MCRIESWEAETDFTFRELIQRTRNVEIFTGLTPYRFVEIPVEAI